MRLKCQGNGRRSKARIAQRTTVTVLGGSQIRPNIHIDDLVDVYLFALDHRLAGVYNAGFENLSVLDIAERIAARVPGTFVKIRCSHGGIGLLGRGITHAGVRW